MKPFVFLSFIISFFISCTNSERFSAKIKTLDSLETELDKKLAVFLSIDSQKISSSLRDYELTIKLIGDSLTDTLSINQLQLFKEFKNCEAPLIFLNENYMSIISESELSRQQLKKLSKDLTNNSIDDELAFEYYTIEKIEAEKMSTALTDNHILAKQTLDTFQKYNTALINYIKQKSFEK